MSTQGPTLETTRLILRPYREEDVKELLPLIGAREVAATTLRIPHPYSEKDAREFIVMMQHDSENVRRAVTLRSDGRIVGGVGLHLNEKYRHAELGYWIGVPYWGRGYATEAAAALIHYGFEELQLHRIFANHFGHNPASGRVLKKLGMKYEGCQRQHYLKWNEFIDSEQYGILRDEWEAREYNV
jgi:[ribosomal protein S5]-alanine N-acetyltransferase